MIGFQNYKRCFLFHLKSSFRPIISYQPLIINPPHQGMAGLKLHLKFLELKNCLTSSYVKFALLMLNINDGVPL